MGECFFWTIWFPIEGRDVHVYYSLTNLVSKCTIMTLTNIFNINVLSCEKWSRFDIMIYFAVYQIYRSKSVGVWISDGRSQKNLPDFTESASTCCSVRPETPATRLTGPALRVTTDGTFRRSTSTTWMYFRWVNDFSALVNFFLFIIKLHII